MLQSLSRSLRKTLIKPRMTSSSSWFSTEKKEEETSNQKEEETEEKPTSEEEAVDPLTTAEAKVEELETMLASEKEDARKQYMSILAEMENVRRIAKNDVEKANTYSIQKFAKSLLSTSDNLARAIEAVEKEDGLADATPALLSLHEGVVMTEKELVKVFNSVGIEKFGSVGDTFDPNKYEAMFEYEDAALEPGSVGQVITQGYSFKDRVLRPAQVGFIKVV